MRSLWSNHKGELAVGLTLAAGAAATYYGGPAAGEAVRDYAPKALEALSGLFGG